jgi:hypothetical protein
MKKQLQFKDFKDHHPSDQRKILDEYNMWKREEVENMLFALTSRGTWRGRHKDSSVLSF